MVVTITLNPALDRIMFVREYVPNQANRIYRRENCIGGKGAHVSFNLASLGLPSLATGIALGENGRRFIDMLSEAGASCSFLVDDGGETRTNYVVVEDNGSCTLICEKGPELTENLRQAFLALFSGLVLGAGCVVISGDASNYTGEAGSVFFRALLRHCAEAGARVLLDANGQLLSEGVRLKPYMIKPNAVELSELTGLPADTEAQVIAAMHALDELEIPVVAVSLGGEGSLVRWEGRLYRVSAAQVQVRNTVGCGDAYLTGLVYGLDQGLAPAECLRYAAACGGAEAENPLTVGLDPARVKTLYDQIFITELEE